MVNPKKFLVSAAIAAGLVGGEVVGVVLGVPGVSGAQTTTVPNSPPTTVAPDPARPPHANGSGTCGSGTNLGFRHRGDGGAGRV